MEMSIEEAINHLGNYSSTNGSGLTTDKQHNEAKRVAIDTMRKYQMFQAQYVERLRADMAAMITELQMDISELKSYESADGQDLVMLADIGTLFQQKINNLKED